ncbi:hypothetical protein [Microbulbifer celer]|uniref:Uncharacterized protein n=1 Tax=Microbulbifer celer TaxID=435905 RepID=A0ABW3UD91_9GAMM|nr:hypothetical protein [Microbulbifer celer]UFN57494.1 hypothetical protein LPW13_00170 [Microbulbifer celer]
MKLKKLATHFSTMALATVSLFTQAHEGHAPPGVVHELHHILWVAMALAVSAIAVFLIRKSSKSKNKTPD